MSNTIMDFISRECKSGFHQNCHGRWEGLGFEIVCICKCLHDKKERMLERVDQPLSNTKRNIQPSSFQGVTYLKND